MTDVHRLLVVILDAEIAHTKRNGRQNTHVQEVQRQTFWDLRVFWKNFTALIYFIILSYLIVTFL